MSRTADLASLKATVAKLQKEADRAEGVYNESMKQIREEFQCDSLPQAQKLLKSLRKKEAKAREEYDRRVAAFLDKWKDLL